MNRVIYVLLAMTILSGVALSSPAFADNTSIVDKINLTVPVSCSLSGTGMDSHVTTLQNGHSNSTIGESTITAYCNDLNGFSIYAVGFTNNEYGNNHLVSTTASGTNSISTGTNTSGDTSSWAMKLTPITNPTPTYPITIIGSTDDTDKTPTTLDYTSFQPVPNEYALVARRKASTDVGTNAEGSSFKTTYQAYAASGQAAGTYEGQVRYTLVHPYNAGTPKRRVTKNLELVFDGGGLYFDDERTISQNIMNYSLSCDSQIVQAPQAVMKTSNLNDEGDMITQYGSHSIDTPYHNNLAAKLRVTTRYGFMKDTGYIGIYDPNSGEWHEIPQDKEEFESKNIAGTETLMLDGGYTEISVHTETPYYYENGFDYGVYIVIEPLDENDTPLSYELLSDCNYSLIEGEYKKPKPYHGVAFDGTWRYGKRNFSFPSDIVQFIIANPFLQDRVIITPNNYR